MHTHGQFEFVPGRVHRCAPPDPGGSEAPSRLPLGTVWKCLDGSPTCGRRWRLAQSIDGAPESRWVRRWLPWRPWFGVERRGVPGVVT